MFDNFLNRKGSGVTGREIGFNNLMPLSSPITMGEPRTSIGRMIRDAITPPPVNPTQPDITDPHEGKDDPSGNRKE